MPSNQRVEQPTFAHVRWSDDCDAGEPVGGISAGHLLLGRPDELGSLAEPLAEIASLDKANVLFFDEVESGFQVGKQPEQISSQPMQWRRKTAGKLLQGIVQSIRIARIDHAEHRFSLRQIQSAREEGSQREFPWLC